MGHHRELSKFRIFDFGTRKVIAASDTKRGVQNYFDSCGKDMNVVDVCVNPQGGKDYFVEEQE